MNSVLRDARYALRQLAKTPTFTIAALLTLALGLGVTVAMFSVLDQVLLRPLPFGNAKRLVWFSGVNSANPNSFDSMSMPDLKDMAARTHSLEGIGYYTFQLPTLKDSHGEAKVVPELTASANLFDLLGVRPMLGRGFVPDDARPGRNNVLVLGNTVWKEYFHGDRGIVGRPVTINGDPYTVIGVLAPGVAFPGHAEAQEIYSPLLNDDKDLTDRGSAALSPFGLLRPGATLEQARTELNGIRNQLRKEYPKDESKEAVKVENYRDWLTSAVRPSLRALNYAVLAVWLIACANVAGLMLTRANGRRREMAIVTALGAPRGRVVRQVLTEGLLLAIGGGAIGLGLAAIALRVLRHYLSTRVIFGSYVHINGTVCLYLLVATVVSALLFGLAPAWISARVPAQEGLREGTSGGGVSRKQVFWRDALVVGEITLTLALLIAAGLMMRTLLALRHAEEGFVAENVVSGNLYFPTHGAWWVVRKESTESNLITSFYQPMLERLKHTPGIEAAGLTTVRPLQPNWNFQSSVKVKGRVYAKKSDEAEAQVRATTAGYYKTYEVRLLKGRFFNDEVDTPDTPISLVVNEAFVKKVFPKESPLGKQVEVGNEKNPNREWGTIVGVADNVRQWSPSDPSLPEMDVDLMQLTPKDDYYPILSGFLMSQCERSFPQRRRRRQSGMPFIVCVPKSASTTYSRCSR